MHSVNRHGIPAGTRGVTGALATAVIGLLPLTALAAHQAPHWRWQLGESAMVVNYADLDITTTPGAERLLERIQYAAAQLCPQVSFQELERHAASLRCRNEVVAHAVSSIDSPQLAAVFASRTHHITHSPV